ncbi:hypothetical protein AV530_017781 [Patagioenas fasciata monilis]|uniref:Mos1 transposase HTH domain-containing protein n=1 Tax=Patagioenas fasciata monilis TaxID=372326 RepID=A0A1V4J912_PATFA|nr:hypothetical protein AV530_017781 [Patagioenas fasciata monilis]
MRHPLIELYHLSNLLQMPNDCRMAGAKRIAIFLLNFKMGCKAAETTRNINYTFAPGTANKCTVQWWFKKLPKGDESLKEVDHDQLRAIIKSDPLTTTREVGEEFKVDHSMVIRHLKQIGKSSISH